MHVPVPQSVVVQLQMRPTSHSRDARHGPLTARSSFVAMQFAPVALLSERAQMKPSAQSERLAHVSRLPRSGWQLIGTPPSAGEEPGSG